MYSSRILVCYTVQCLICLHMRQHTIIRTYVCCQWNGFSKFYTAAITFIEYFFSVFMVHCLRSLSATPWLCQWYTDMNLWNQNGTIYRDVEKNLKRLKFALKMWINWSMICIQTLSHGPIFSSFTMQKLLWIFWHNRKQILCQFNPITKNLSRIKIKSNGI